MSTLARQGLPCALGLTAACVISDFSSLRHKQRELVMIIPHEDSGVAPQPPCSVVE